MPKGTSNRKSLAKQTQVKPSLSTWLSIANLGLTAIIGIVVAIYLNIRNEEFQKYLIEIQDQSKYANIELTGVEPTIYSDVAFGWGIEIRNSGPAAAKDIRISICIRNINDVWSEKITNINNFDFYFTDQSLKTEIEYTATCISPLDEKGENDGIVFVVDALSPNQSTQLIVNIDNQVQRKTVDSSRQSQIIIPRQIIPAKLAPPSYLYFKEPLSRYLTDKYYMASFAAQTSCGNCKLSDDEDGVLGSIITIFDWKWEKEIVQLASSDTVEANFDLSLSYDVPADFDDKSIDKPLYLVLDPNYYFIKEMTKSDYDSMKSNP